MAQITLPQYLVLKAGLWRGSQLLAWLGEWAIAMRKNDWQPITMDHYCAYAKVSRAAGYRRLNKWFEITTAHPNDVIEELRETYLQLLDAEDEAEVYGAISSAPASETLVAA